MFDSGLGGVFIAQSIRKHLPVYDYVFLGDTLNMPYGQRSDGQIYDLSERAMRYLLAQDCDLIIVACNTASVSALRKLQQVFLAREFPDKRILGVVVPTLEVAIDSGSTNIGMIATSRTVNSNIYGVELQKINPLVQLHAFATPLLTPLIEYNGAKYIDSVLEDYLAPLKAARVESVILGCTHYVAIKKNVSAIMGEGVRILSQDDIIPLKLADYLSRHKEMEERLSQGGTLDIHATDTNESFTKNVQDMVGDKCDLVTANYHVAA